MRAGKSLSRFTGFSRIQRTVVLTFNSQVSRDCGLLLQKTHTIKIF